MTTTTLSNPIRPVFLLLKMTFAIVPIVAGIDKFTDFLTQWEKYLDPRLAALIPVAPHTFMCIVGVIEIIAGIIVIKKPLLGGYIVATWLVIISATLITSGHYLDIAVRELVMATGAFSLAKIASLFDNE